MVTVYTKNNCPQCEMTKAMLNDEGVEYEIINVEDDATSLKYIKELGFASLPVVIGEDICPFSGFRPDRLLKLK